MKTTVVFFVEIGRNGNIFDYSKKSMVSQSRNAYGFTRAFMLTGNEDYLVLATSALNFMYEHLWDQDYGGWYKRCKENGDSPYTGDKSAFDQHYALLGITAFFEATGDSIHFKNLNKGYEFIENYLWDYSELYGYYDQTNRSGNNSQGKSFNATVDAITTHLYNLYLMTGDEKYYNRLIKLKENIIDYLVASMDEQEIGFAENYNTDWTIDESENRTIMGHVLKTSWCLGRIYRIEKDEETLNAAIKLFNDVYENGYDHEYGGPYKDYDRKTGEMYMYGAYDIAKAWWQMEQAITSGLMLFEITWDFKYLNVAQESLEFFMNYFIDPEYGEVYADRSRDGGRVSYSGGYWDENKGSEWKAGYHSIETAYYSYLYSNLLLKQTPVTLYYRFNPTASDRSIRMNPLAVDFSKLKISSITKDGNDYTDFNKDERILNIPANEGGIYKVSYEMIDLENKINENSIQHLSKVVSYPNPFHDKIYFEFELNNSDAFNLKIFNTLGQLLENRTISPKSTGKELIEFDGSTLKPGFYFYQLNFEGQIQTGRIIKK